MFGTTQDAKSSGAKGGSCSSAAKKKAAIDREAAKRAGRTPLAVILQSKRGTDVLLVHDYWLKHCRNCSESSDR